mmetsp:Transcript_13082/g.24453  ORF Transcript_13082/g.24453 Transcript_13082/m.24453 type:complete len:191 (+) Transcript_13082:1078-1650(+)
MDKLGNMETEYKKVELFGGAIEADLPTTALSNSDLLLVPDNQEVYVESVTQATLILEILEHSEVPDVEAIQYLFNDLADSNDAYGPDYSQTLSVRQVAASEAAQLDHACPKYILLGKQHISTERFPGAPRKPVFIYLFLVRMPAVSSDLLFSMCFPEESSSDEMLRLTEQYLQRFMASLRINDMQLFGAS